MRFIYGHHYEVNRGLYWHHGICVGEEKFIHYAAQEGDGIKVVEVLGADSNDKSIHVADVGEFVGDGHPEKVEYKNDDVYPPLKVVARAFSRKGENGYNLWGNNCEHFARWCKIAKSDSLQVNFVKETLKMAATGALLGRFFGPKGTLIGGGLGLLAGAIRSWFSSKPLLPVYKEFVVYASALFFSTRRKHPLGKSFRHASEGSAERSLKFPEGKGKDDSTLVFYYSGSWFFGNENDWFITERAIIFPHRNIYVNFHDVQKIYSSRYNSSRYRLTIDTIDAQTITFPSEFVDAASVAKFLYASVSCTPLDGSDFKIPLKSILKNMLQMLIGGAVITVGVGAFFPDAVPWLIGAFLLVVLTSPFSFMDKNDAEALQE